MTIALDAVRWDNTNHSFGSAASINTTTHTPVGTPKAALVYIVQRNTHVSDFISGVKWGGAGGTAMANITGSPFVQTAGAEHTVIHCYFLGSSVPTGAQLINVTSSAAVDFTHASITLTAATDTAVVAAASNEAATGAAITVSVPIPAGAATMSWTHTSDEWGVLACAVAEIADTSGVTSFVSGGAWSGNSTIAAVTQDAGLTLIGEGAMGSDVASYAYNTSIVVGTEPTDPEVVAAAASGAPILWPFAQKGWR